MLSPVIRGWAAYYRTVVSSEAFRSLDTYVWRLLFKWARWGHRNKPVHRVVARYPGIERHVPRGAASPDVPALASYCAERRKRAKPKPDKYTPRLLTRQAGQCPLCGDHLLSAEQPPQSPREWER